MKLLALLSSMPFESDRIRGILKNVRLHRIAGKNAYRGRIAGIDVVLFNTGIGKVNAAHSASCIFERFPVKAVLNLGVAGAYAGSGLKTGDIAIASKEILGDDGVIDSGGRHSLEKIGIPLVISGRKKYFNEFPLDNVFSKKIIKTIKTGPLQSYSRITQGPFITLSAASGSPSRAAELEKRFKGICENMEGAAIAQVCAIYKTPFVEIRGVSNIAGVRDKRKWDLKGASGNCQEAVLDLLCAMF